MGNLKRLKKFLEDPTTKLIIEEDSGIYYKLKGE